VTKVIFAYGDVSHVEVMHRRTVYATLRVARGGSSRHSRSAAIALPTRASAMSF
jgi:hypothetical protein